MRRASSPSLQHAIARVVSDACSLEWSASVCASGTHAKRSLQKEKGRLRSIVMGDSERSLDAELVVMDGGRTSMT